jgi:VanZ family protein
MAPDSTDPRWRRAAVVTLVLLVAAVVPSPLRRHESWRWFGPDKLLHLVGHAGYAAVLADAFGAGRCSDEQAAVLAVTVSTGHSLASGRLQRWVPGRAFELADVLAGLVGSGLAAGGWYAVHQGSAFSPRR